MAEHFQYITYFYGHSKIGKTSIQKFAKTDSESLIMNEDFTHPGKVFLQLWRYNWFQSKNNVFKI